MISILEVCHRHLYLIGKLKQLDHLWLDDNWKYCFYVHTYKLFNT